MARIAPSLSLRSLRRRARRSIVLRWLLVAVAAAAVAAEAQRVRASAAAAAAAWGAPVTVAVAARDLDAGDTVGVDDARIERRPRAVVPDGALDAVPTGRVLTAAVVAGEVLVAGRVAPGGLSGIAARVPPGWRALSVPTAASGFGVPAPPLEPGDRVDLLAPDVVAAAAIVIEVGDDAVTVAVPAADAGDVAAALAESVVTIALRGSR